MQLPNFGIRPGIYLRRRVVAPHIHVSPKFADGAGANLEVSDGGLCKLNWILYLFAKIGLVMRRV